MLSISLSLTSASITGASGPSIQLSDASVDEDAGVGDLVATLSVSGGSGTYTFTLTDDAGGLFALDAVDDTRLEVAAALTAGTESITIEADNGVDPVLTRTIMITIESISTGGIMDFSNADNSSLFAVVLL
jgi:hypothetical protein